jgi:hypothetical protein
MDRRQLLTAAVWPLIAQPAANAFGKKAFANCAEPEPQDWRPKQHGINSVR